MKTFHQQNLVHMWSLLFECCPSLACDWLMTRAEQSDLLQQIRRESDGSDTWVESEWSLLLFLLFLLDTSIRQLLWWRRGQLWFGSTNPSVLFCFHRAEEMNNTQLTELEDDIQQQLARTEERVRQEASVAPERELGFTVIFIYTSRSLALIWAARVSQ